ncbi:MAG: Hemolysin-type calcium-binding repeat (2 copies) [Phormidesmis priestleyi Ana]|uniref:Hemolysin-type calcium-binding repeat (2 copies) n=1 Tax=Phormidesmis priestleyi Ana TaxID=1666911 RepID=A0A0P8DHG1_9CYAN|nr:MAG: Hemolysin-type calcium-binding repeat (2 copies) [Phormidesmis priestleyi Ana]
MSLVIGTELNDRILTRGEDGEGDVIYALGGDDIVVSSSGKDVVFGELGADLLIGGDGDDFLNGSTRQGGVEGGGNDGNDRIYGGDGNDVIFGGSGLDVLTGGAGEDLFIFNWGDNDAVDTITDFTVGEDQIEFQGIGDRKIAYDAITGIVSVDGQAFIQLDPGLDFSEDDYFLQ